MDRQKVGISMDFFSEEMEKILRELKYSSEADFVRIIRKWYQACDECGIPSLQQIAWSQSNAGPPVLEICIWQDFSPSHQVHRWYACHNFQSHFNYHLITLHSVFHCTTGKLQSPCNLHTWYRVFLFRSYSDGIFQTWYPKILWYSKTYFPSCRVKQSPSMILTEGLNSTSPKTLHTHIIWWKTLIVTTGTHISTTGSITSDFARSIRNGAKFRILSNKIGVFLEFSLICTELMRAKS